MDRLAIIDAEARRFAEVLAPIDPDTRCPTCPDWSAADLLWHLTEVHYFWAGILTQGVLSESELPAVEAAKPGRPSTVGELLALREDATTRLVRALAARDDAEP
ncbi:MAG TPA: maleylpyruvate isomerase N-terminal domain-containing protein, partial [Mycobacterium sp.]|nr:maleylpyruvate isomerase N-terminal domain-containing protein [Mycobacterium sp.]